MAVDPTRIGALPNEMSQPTPQPTAPGAGTVPASGVTSTGGRAALLRATYQAVLKAKGVPYLAANDPALLMIYQAIGGLTPEQAQVAANQAGSYFTRNGFAMSDQELDQTIDGMRGPAGTGFNPIVGAGAGIRQDYSGLAAARGVPYLPGGDPQFTTAIQQRVPGLTAQQAAQIAERGRDFYLKTGVMVPDAAVDQFAGEAKQFRVPLPHQFDPARWDALMADPTAAGLFEGTVKAAGWDWDTYKRQHLASRPVGVAAPSTGGGGWNSPAGVWG